MSELLLMKFKAVLFKQNHQVFFLNVIIECKMRLKLKARLMLKVGSEKLILVDELRHVKHVLQTVHNS